MKITYNPINIPHLALQLKVNVLSSVGVGVLGPEEGSYGAGGPKLRLVFVLARRPWLFIDDVFVYLLFSCCRIACCCCCHCCCSCWTRFSNLLLNISKKEKQSQRKHIKRQCQGSSEH